MGLKSVIDKASGDVCYKGFNRAQTEQLKLAESCVTNSECFRHPEWGPTLMNLCFNREKAGDSISGIYYLADWLKKYFPIGEDGILYDDTDTVIEASKFFKHGSTPPTPEFKEDGSFNLAKFKFDIVKNKALLSGSTPLFSGRLKIPTELNFGDDAIFMGEGDEEGYRIAKQLKSWAANNKSNTDLFNPNDPVDRFVERGWNMFSILLRLDDMNIRGYQLKYAMDYADGSVQKLFEILNEGRSQEMCDYINMKSAKDYLDGDLSRDQIAVTSGASYQYSGGEMYFGGEPMQLKMNDLTAQEFAAKDVKSLSLDYSKLDIRDEISIESAIRICEARGFRIIKRFRRKAKFDDVTYLLFYNPKTRDYVHADSATDENVCYGGVEWTAIRTIPDSRRCVTYGFNGSSGGLDGQDGTFFTYTQHEGLFRAWDTLLEFVPENDYDWTKIGFGHHNIPIPKYFELPFLRDADMFDVLSEQAFFVMRDMGSYYFEGIVNAVLCAYDEELINSLSPHYALCKEWLLKNMLRNCAGWYTGGDSGAMARASAAFSYLKVPDDILSEIISNTRIQFAERDVQDRAFWQGRKEINNEMDFMKLAKKLRNNDEVAEAIVKGYELPDPNSLPVKLPWL